MERVYASFAAIEKKGFSIYFEQLEAFIAVPQGCEVNASPIEGTSNVYAVPRGYRIPGLYIKKGELILMTDAAGQGKISISLSTKLDPTEGTSYYVYPDGHVTRLKGE
jgi:hypothetical protein